MKGQASIIEEDPLVGIVISAVLISIVLLIGVDIVGQVVGQSHSIEIEKCQERFGSDFSNGTMDGEYVCMKDGEVYNPDVHALSSQNSNFLVNMIVAPINFFISLPWWIKLPLWIFAVTVIIWSVEVIGPI